MRYHRLMQSVKTRNGRRAYLWWLDHYTYEIELDDDTKLTEQAACAGGACEIV
mgnify:CR=1 FL=1